MYFSTLFRYDFVTVRKQLVPYLPAVVRDQLQHQGCDELDNRWVAVPVGQELSIVDQSADVLHQLELRHKSSASV